MCLFHFFVKFQARSIGLGVNILGFHFLTLGLVYDLLRNTLFNFFRISHAIILARFHIPQLMLIQAIFMMFETSTTKTRGQILKSGLDPIAQARQTLVSYSLTPQSHLLHSFFHHNCGQVLFTPTPTTQSEPS